MEGSSPFLRLDAWLWQARLAKTKSACGALILAGGFRLNRQPVTKAHARIRVDDVLTFVAQGKVRVWRVRALGERRGSAEDAQGLYEEIPEAEQ